MTSQAIFYVLLYLETVHKFRQAVSSFYEGGAYKVYTVAFSPSICSIPVKNEVIADICCDSFQRSQEGIQKIGL